MTRATTECLVWMVGGWVGGPTRLIFIYYKFISSYLHESRRSDEAWAGVGKWCGARICWVLHDAFPKNDQDTVAFLNSVSDDAVWIDWIILNHLMHIVDSTCPLSWRCGFPSNDGIAIMLPKMAMNMCVVKPSHSCWPKFACWNWGVVAMVWAESKPSFMPSFRLGHWHSCFDFHSIN